MPILSLNGSYEIHVLLFKDKEQGNVKYTIYDPDGIEIGHKTINQEGTEWSDVPLGTFSLKKGSYVQVADMPAKCNADALRFEYILSLCIITPTQASPANVGDYNNPSHIKNPPVKIEVKEGTIPITDLTNADFSFKIGEKSAVASLIDTPISGEYVFDVTPPKQDAAGKYDLEVSVQYSDSTFEDTEEEAVIYTAGGHADVTLIIDRSGSMSGSAIADARNSAKLFVDYMRDDDYAGVVSFASSVSYNYHLTPLTADIKIAIKNAIDGISAGGMTAMGAGLRYGLNDLASLGDPTHSWAMVLLSDGYHNTGEHPYTVLPDIQALDIRVFTIGLGPNVDKALLEHIATETDGEYYYAATSDQLREIYELIVGRVVGWQTVLKRKAIIFLNQIIQIFVPIENPAAEAIFSISWGGSDLDLVLYKPDGTKIDPAAAATNPKIEYVEEATYEFYRVTDPDPGEWIMEVTGVDIPPEGEEFTATVKVISPLFMFLTTDKDQYNQGEVIKTIASITEGGLPITGVAVNADITLPDGSPESLTLYDDGGHGDVAADDGVYANYLTSTEQIGNYKIDASATGTTPSGTSFRRQVETTVEVVSGQSLINVTPDTWSETVSPSGQVKTTFTVNDPVAIGELFPINEYIYAEYNGTHYIVYNESSIGGEPDYIIPTSPSRKALVAPPVSKWVSLTATSLQTPTGDIIDVSNIVLSSDVLEVPLGGSNDFNATINVPSGVPVGVYTGKIVASAITGSDSIDVEITISEPPSVEQPQYFKEKSSVQGIGYVAIDKKVQDWKVAVDVEEYMEGFGEFAMHSREILDESARRSDPTDPNYIHQKMINFQGNATNRLINREKFESSAIFGGTGTRINEYFDVSMIQKDESSSIKTIAAPGGRQSHSFATMDEFVGLWGTHSEWQKICEKNIRH
jgi:Mg-chelatase subunit ChlD